MRERATNHETERQLTRKHERKAAEHQRELRKHDGERAKHETEATRERDGDKDATRVTKEE